MFSTELFTQTLISGLMIGVLYALMALGITFIYSIVRMINWAMGEFYMLGSYIQYVAVAYALGPKLWWLAVIISTAGTFLIGYLIEPILIKPMHARAMERRDDYATVVTIALLLMLRSLAVAIGGPYQFRPETNLPIMWVGPLPMEGARVAACLCALLALALFYVLMSKTWMGLALRATAQNRVAAQTSGVDVFRLDAVAFERTLTGEDLLAYLRQRLPAADVPRVVVLDNASMHTSKVFKAHRKALADEGVYLYYLPAYSPQLNKIEGIFKQVKHHEIAKRSHTTRAELRLSVEQGFDSYARKLRDKRCGQSRPAA